MQGIRIGPTAGGIGPFLDGTTSRHCYPGSFGRAITIEFECIVSGKRPTALDREEDVASTDRPLHTRRANTATGTWKRFG